MFISNNLYYLDNIFVKIQYFKNLNLFNEYKYNQMNYYKRL